MKDEIKEMFCSLEELKRTIDCYDGYSDNEEVYYFIGALRFAYDYITNLQEENENLKDYLKIMEKGKDNNLNRFLDYKSRCEKALDKLYCYGEVFDSKILQQFQKEMENTLNGGDKDE